MPPFEYRIRQRRRIGTRTGPTPGVETPYVPDTAPVVESPQSGVMSRVWLEWARRVTDLAATAEANGGGGGAPDPHHVTHEPGGSDPMAVDAAPAVGSLRTLGTGPNQAAPGNDARFTAPSVPTAHHATHEPGGADPLANAAWTNLANIFTDSQTFSKVTPSLNLNDTSGAADTKRFRIVNSGGLYFIALSDAGVGQATPLVLNRSGDAIVGRDCYATRDLYADGAGGNVACKNQANVFTANQAISMVSPTLLLTNTGGAANNKTFQILGTGQTLYLQALTDALAVDTTPLYVTRAGDLAIARDIYEKNRTTPMGHRVTVPYAAANFTATAGMTWTVEAGDVALNTYTVIGKTVIWAVQIAAASISGTPGSDLYIACPAGLALTVGTTKSTFCLDAGVAIEAQISSYDGLKIRITKTAGGNWGVGVNNMYVYFTGIFFAA